MSRAPRPPDQPCSVARAAALLADPWVIVLLRDALRGVRRFDDFQALSGAAKTVVADRLKRLVAAGLLARRRYAERPPRDEYVLTPAGREAFPVVMALMAWGDRHLAGAGGVPFRLRHRDCGEVTSPGGACTACGEALAPEALRLEPGPGGAGPEARRMRERLALARKRIGPAEPALRRAEDGG